MAKIKPRELRQMSIEALEARLLELKKELSKINTKLSSGTAPENPGRVREVKKAIARMLTIITEKKKQPEKKEETKEKKSEKKVEAPKESKVAKEEKKAEPKKEEPKPEIKENKPAAKKETPKEKEIPKEQSIKSKEVENKQ